jgi:hypothetical protein
MEMTWSFLDEEMIREAHNSTPPKEFHNTIRASPKKWTKELIAQVYHLPLDGQGMILTKENHIAPYFKCKIDSKGGWKVSQCQDSRMRAIFAFMIPLIHPDKSRRVTIKIGNTIEAAYQSKKKISWATIFAEAIQRSLKIENRGYSYLSSYIVHLYAHENLLFKHEKVALGKKQSYVKYGASDPDVKVSSESEEAQEEEIEDLGEDSPFKRVTRGHTSRNLNFPTSGGTLSTDTQQQFDTIEGSMLTLHTKVVLMESTLMSLSKMLGVPLKNIVEEVGDLVGRNTSQDRVQELERALETEKSRNVMLEEKLQRKLDHDNLLQTILKSMSASLNLVEPLTCQDGKDLVTKEVYTKYLYQNPSDPNLAQIIDIVEDYGSQVTSSFEGMRELLESLRTYSTLLLRKEEETFLPFHPPSTTPLEEIGDSPNHPYSPKEPLSPLPHLPTLTIPIEGGEGEFPSARSETTAIGPQ